MPLKRLPGRERGRGRERERGKRFCGLQLREVRSFQHISIRRSRVASIWVCFWVWTVCARTATLMDFVENLPPVCVCVCVYAGRFPCSTGCHGSRRGDLSIRSVFLCDLCAMCAPLSVQVFSCKVQKKNKRKTQQQTHTQKTNALGHLWVPSRTCVTPDAQLK